MSASRSASACSRPTSEAVHLSPSRMACGLHLGGTLSQRCALPAPRSQASATQALHLPAESARSLALSASRSSMTSSSSCTMACLAVSMKGPVPR
eukprot:13460180-Alexandrium_andersonii.AAC.1